MKNLLIHWPLILFMLVWCPATMAGFLGLVYLHADLWTLVGWVVVFGLLTGVFSVFTFPSDSNYLNRGSYE